MQTVLCQLETEYDNKIQMNKFIIGTWNLRHGGGNRVNQILESIGENNNLDVIVLTEFRNNQNKPIIENGLKIQGFEFIATIEVEPRLNSVLIASKKKFNNIETFPVLIIHSQRVLKVKIEGLNIYGCYFPGQDLKKEIFEFLLTEIESKGKENTIITGDINTGKHYLDENGATFFHSDYLDRFEEKGMIDAWRKIHGEKKEFTWFSNAGNGFRLDHFFIDNNLSDKIIKCEYKHKYREDKISDHSMMILELGK